MPCRHISHQSVVVLEDRFIMLTGGSREQNRHAATDSVFVFDANLEKWVGGATDQLPSLKEARVDHSMCAIGLTAYVFGGQNGTYDCLNTLEYYSL